MSKAQTGEKHPLYGKKHTDEAKKKISEFRKGKDFKTPEGKERQRIALSGSNNVQAKLTETSVLDIREKYTNGIKACDLAEFYGVTLSVVHKVIRRASWKHI